MTPPPAEWAPQSAIFIGFPSDGSLWLDDLAPAQVEVAAMANALAEDVAVELVADGAEAVAAARAAVPSATVHDVPMGDIWLRDTGPIFRAAGDAALFRFNGWGGKYVLDHDDEVGARLAGLKAASVTQYDMILEGGAIDGDGQGLFLTTEQCLLNPNRNPSMGRREVEQLLAEALGARRLVWLGEGLLNDHTDGHVDNLARFVTAGTVALPAADGPDDPNAAIYADARRRLQSAGLAVADMPSVGRYEVDGEIKPASYMNWIVANKVVAVPLYGMPNDKAAVDAVKRLYPRHRVVGLPAGHVLTGGGSFHCITQQVPKG